jgi:hypothetical protein
VYTNDFCPFLYRWETWTHILRERHRLRTSEHRLPRNLIESSIEEVRKDHTKLHNEKLRDLHQRILWGWSSLDNWIGRECGRHGKASKVYKILVENLKRKVPVKDLGVNRRIVYIRYLKKRDERAWNGILCLETHQQRHLLNMTMKIRVHSRNFCASWVPSSFQRMTATSSQYLYLINTEVMPGLYLMYRQYRKTYLSYEAKVWTFLRYTARSTEHSYPTSNVLIWAETCICLLRGLTNWTQLYMRFPEMPLKSFSILSHIPYTIFTTYVCSSLVVCKHSHVYDLIIFNYSTKNVKSESGRSVRLKSVFPLQVRLWPREGL